MSAFSATTLTHYLPGSPRCPVLEPAFRINRGIKIYDDAIASIKTEGLIGDRYVSIDPGGGTDELLQPGGTITETESPTDIQELISKYAFGDVEK
jgi:phospholipid/cholesterol/gamma-HCH transport system substrate-binding protein